MTETRILRTKHGAFIPATWDGKNSSGIEPVCDKVLILVDRGADKVGGIHITDTHADQHTLASLTGVLVAVGPQAFGRAADGSLWEEIAIKPKPGMRVCFERYAGQEYTGEDGQLYRVMDYRSIAGTQGWAERTSDMTASSSIVFAQSVEAA